MATSMESLLHYIKMNHYQIVPCEGKDLCEEGDQPGFDPRLHRLRVPLLQHPPRLHQLLRVPLQRGGHQVGKLIQIKRPVWYFSRIGDI